MKILFSVYIEDHETGSVELKESLWIQTNWSIEQIEKHIALHNGFRSEIAIGNNLSFFDYFCFFADYSELIRRINEIPNNEDVESCTKTPCFFRVKEFEPGCADEPLHPKNQNYFLFEIERYECGASGYEAIVYWASTHPLEMVFIGGIVYDFIKWFMSRVLRFLGLKKHVTSVRPMVLNTKNLYKNFSKVIKVKVSDCQITKINRIKAGIFHVKMRTLTGRKFKINCFSDGSIDSFEEVSNCNE